MLFPLMSFAPQAFFSSVLPFLSLSSYTNSSVWHKEAGERGIPVIFATFVDSSVQHSLHLIDEDLVLVDRKTTKEGPRPASA